jgi:ribA/ribD-fused uncharacterized protein
MGKDGFIIYDKHVAFWGSEFSNFYPCRFTFDGVEWKSSEQCFMAQKAKFFNDEETYDLILKSKTPEEAKKLGRLVKNYDDGKWSEVREEKMYNAVLQKFLQNRDLQLVITRKDLLDKSFVEGSPFDGVWGVKMDYRNDLIDDESNWNGTNLLGKVLNRVRNYLLRN